MLFLVCLRFVVYVVVLSVVCLRFCLYDVYSFWYVVVLAGVCLRFAFGVLVFLFCGVGVLLLVCRCFSRCMPLF